MIVVSSAEGFDRDARAPCVHPDRVPTLGRRSRSWIPLHWGDSDIIDTKINTGDVRRMSLTLTQLAKASNVSLSLVSRLMRDDPTLRVSGPTKQRVMATKARLERESGHALVVPSRIERPRTFMASLEVGAKQSLSSGTDSFNLYRLVQEIELELTDRGHVLALTYSDDAAHVKQAEQVADPNHPVDGVIFLWSHITTATRDTLLGRRVPHVVFHPWLGEYEQLQTIRPLKEESFPQARRSPRRAGTSADRVRRVPETALPVGRDGDDLRRHSAGFAGPVRAGRGRADGTVERLARRYQRAVRCLAGRAPRMHGGDH